MSSKTPVAKRTLSATRKGNAAATLSATAAAAASTTAVPAAAGPKSAVKRGRDGPSAAPTPGKGLAVLSNNKQCVAYIMMRVFDANECFAGLGVDAAENGSVFVR